MVENTNVIALAGYFVVGLVIGWGILVLRDDIRIKRRNQFRKMRAMFLASLTVIFVTTLVFESFPGFLVCSAGCLVVLAYAARKKGKPG